jgi:hypothetical protein
VLAEQVFGALGAQRGDVVHAAGPERPGPQQPPAPVADDGGLDGVLFLLARHKRPPPGPPGLGAADLHLGAVDPQLDAFGGGVCEHIGQRAQPELTLARHGEPPGGQQRAHLMGRPG